MKRQYQLVMPYREGHLSIGIDLEDDPLELARKISTYLQVEDASRV